MSKSTKLNWKELKEAPEAKYLMKKEKGENDKRTKVWTWKQIQDTIEERFQLVGKLFNHPALLKELANEENYIPPRKEGRIQPILLLADLQRHFEFLKEKKIRFSVAGLILFTGDPKASEKGDKKSVSVKISDEDGGEVFVALWESAYKKHLTEGGLAKRRYLIIPDIGAWGNFGFSTYGEVLSFDVSDAKQYEEAVALYEEGRKKELREFLNVVPEEKDYDDMTDEEKAAADAEIAADLDD